MTPEERLKMALQGQYPDRPPFTALLSMYGSRMLNCDLETYFNNPALYAEGQAAVFETFEPDLLFGPFLMSLLAESFGGEIRYHDTQAPALVRTGLTDVNDIDKLVMPDVDSDPRIVYLREAIRKLAETCGSCVPIAATALSPLDFPVVIMGLERWLDTFLFHPDLRQRVLDKTTPFFLDFCHALLGEGASCVVFPSAFLSPAILPSEVAISCAFPPYIEALAMVEAPVFVHHGGTPFSSFLHSCRHMPENCLGIVLDHTDSLEEARGKVGDELVLLGGIDGPTLWCRSEQEIFDRCTDVLEDRKDDPRFILATSGADIPLNTPLENILAISRAVKEFNA